MAGTIEWRINGATVFETTKARFGLHPQSVYVGTTTNATNCIRTLRISGVRVYSGDSAYSLRLVDAADDTLQNVVEALCERAGMPAGTYDATALAAITKPVRAYTVAQVTSARAVIDQLMSAYFFTAYVTDKLYFIPRAGSAVLTLDADDLGSGIDRPAEELLPLTIGSDEEVPAQIALSYSNVDSDYNVATELSDRLLSGVISTSTVPLALGMTSAEAKGIADAILVDQYVGRISGSVALPMAYAELTPGDVVLAPDDLGNLYRVRLVRRTDAGPLLSFDWVLDDATALTSAGITSTDYTPSVTVALPGSTTLTLLDIPLLRDAENRLGHYVAATSASTSWPGAAVYRSVDDIAYDQAATVSERAVAGVATTVLGDWTGGRVFDETNSLTIALTYGTLSSSTRSAMFLDTSVNALAVGDEIIRFRTATLVSGSTYTVTGLLRGQRGTEWATGSHSLGDACVLLQTSGLRYVDMEVADIDEARYYKGVTLGKTLSSVATAQTLTSAGVSLMPLAPVQLRALRISGGDIELSWQRRTRLESTFAGAAGSVVPVGEAIEIYSVDVVRVSDGAVLRTITATTNAATYTATQQLADGVSGSTAIRIDVYQVSATVGRGLAASRTTVGGVSAQAQIVEVTVGGTFATGAVC
ncbi:MAG: phage tail protein, partial [Rubrivivax sp.]|nr:phage tail protein [Rubrivivax sp.]